MNAVVDYIKNIKEPLEIKAPSGLGKLDPKNPILKNLIFPNEEVVMINGILLKGKI